MLLPDNEVQADIVAKLKTLTTVTSLLPEGSSGIKELQWQGDTFQYPAIRLDLEKNEYEFDEQARCGLYSVEFSIYIFSQERSSKQVSQIKGLIENLMTGIDWHGTYAKYSRLRLIDSIPAVREDSITWRSQLRYSTKIQGLP